VGRITNELLAIQVPGTLEIWIDSDFTARWRPCAQPGETAAARRIELERREPTVSRSAQPVLVWSARLEQVS
jgi:hypothetical protein